MFGNIWLSSALIVIAIFSAGAMYKSYSDIQEAKQIQQHYEIISEIKTLLAIQYNKDPDKITRDEIIAHLPKGKNWEKILLLDRNSNSDLSNKEFINKDGKIEISEDEKLKLLALKAKLKDITNTNNISPVNGKYTFEIGQKEKNTLVKDTNIEKSLNIAIHFLGVEILYSSKTPSEAITALLADENKFIPYDEMYQDFRTDSEIASNTTLTEEINKERKQNYFKAKIKEKLYKNESSVETRLYKELESLL